MTQHKQVLIYNNIFQEHVQVDEGLVNVLKLIWNIGLPTLSSYMVRENKCEYVRIEFYSVLYAENFVTYVLDHCPKIIDYVHETTYQRIINHGCKHCWKFTLSPERIVKNGIIEGIYFSGAVLFPLDDL